MKVDNELITDLNRLNVKELIHLKKIMDFKIEVIAKRILNLAYSSSYLDLEHIKNIGNVFFTNVADTNIEENRISFYYERYACGESDTFNISVPIELFEKTDNEIKQWFVDETKRIQKRIEEDKERRFREQVAKDEEQDRKIYEKLKQRFEPT